MDFPILSLIFMLPILGALPTYIVGKVKAEYSKYLALVVGLVVAGLSFLAYLLYADPIFEGTHLLDFVPDFLEETSKELYTSPSGRSGEFKLVENIEWVPFAGISYLVGVDGLSLPLVMLTGYVSLAAIIASWEIEERVPAYFGLILLLQTGITGTFIALDWFLFYIAWELVLVPMFFLIGIWGGPRREYAAIKFFIYTHVASLGLLLAIIGLYIEAGLDTFSLIEMAEHDFGNSDIIKLVFLGFMFGFLVKVPSVPFHTWLPDAHVEAPTPISMILAGLLLKMGGYGILRVCGWYLPQPLTDDVFRYGIAIIGLISIVYGGLVAMRQSDLKRLVAYSSIAHMGFVLIGVASQTEAGFVGANYMQIAHGVISPLLFFLSGVILHHAHTREIPKIRALTYQMPITVAVLVFASFASAGLPGLAGFIAEFSVVLGVLDWEPWVAVVAGIGIIITAAYYLWMLQRVVFGQVNPDLADVHRAYKVEWIPFVMLIIATVVLGLLPSWMIDIMNPAAEYFLSQF
ncbi:MAG: NuoM family protein [Promethearchaeota archaeon]